MIQITAYRAGTIRPEVRFRARSLDSGIRTAARKLGVSLAYGHTTERVGSSQYRVVGDVAMMVVSSEV